MKIKTKIFGEVEIDDSRVIRFESGIIGFPDLTDFSLMHDAENEDGHIRWLQSHQEPAFAMPVIDPLLIMSDYNPQVEDELIAPIGGMDSENMLVLVTITVPKNIEEMSVNLRAPIIIHTDTRKAVQIIVDEDRYPVRYRIYDLLKENRKGGDK